MRLLLMLARWVAERTSRLRAHLNESTPTQKRLTALFAVLVVLVGVYSYLYARANFAGAEEAVVTVAAQNLTAPRTLTEVDLEELVLPQRGVPEGAMKKSDLVGTVLMDSVEKREMILRHNVQVNTDPTSVASADLFDRYFAVNIDVNWLNSSLPDLKPGDRVSLMTSVLVPRKGPQAQVVASAARVIRVNERGVTINVTEEEVNQLLVTRSLNLPLQVVVHPNKVETITEESAELPAPDK